MKTSKALFALLMGVALLSVNDCFSQVIHTIVLNVDTSTLNEGDTENAFSFSVTSNTEFENIDDPKNFTIFVDEDDTVVWEGTSTSGALVNIETIAHVATQDSKNIFRKAKKDGRTENGRKKVKQKVLKQKKGQQFTYDIAFSIGASTFNIDPKIKVNN